MVALADLVGLPVRLQEFAMKTGYLGVQFAEVGVALDNEYFALGPWWADRGRLRICKNSLQVLGLAISDLGSACAE